MSSYKSKITRKPPPRVTTPEPSLQYAAVPLGSPPQSPGSPPARSRTRRTPASSRAPTGFGVAPSDAERPAQARGTGRAGAALVRGVASGSIGADFGPYSFDPEINRSNPGEGTRLRKAPSTVRPNLTRTTTVNTRFEKNLDLDDALHNPDPVADARMEHELYFFSARGWATVTALFVLFGGLVTLFAGFPLIYYFGHPPRKFVGYNIGGINASGQVPELTKFPSLIDSETPSNAYTHTGTDGKKYRLAFSDEFNTDGRTFFPGDDPYWEAVDFHYWPTGDLEWYDPAAITTQDGKLVITMSEVNYTDNHGLNFMSGMLQSWNKICMTTAYVEVSLSLPGAPDQPGFWPGAWLMGNLGRAGYGATTEGMWPYSYDSCDTGTFPNQTTKDNQPSASFDSHLSFLPGQRLSACTCPGSDHPGPAVTKGRGVPEIDLLEAQIEILGSAPYFQGQASQSFQVAPYNLNRLFDNSSQATPIVNSSMTQFNNYHGNQYQQTVSALTYIDAQYYGGNAYQTYGLEWYSNPAKRSSGYLNWLTTGEKRWTMTAASVGADSGANVSARLIPEEPMYMIFNLGMSPSFQGQDFLHMVFPAKMFIDYVRVYQLEGTQDGLTCDPPKYPTADYIASHIAAYSNANLTTWAQAGYTFPRNSLYDGC